MRFIGTQSNYQTEYKEMRRGVIAAMVMMVTPDAEIAEIAREILNANAGKFKAELEKALQKAEAKAA